MITRRPRPELITNPRASTTATETTISKVVEQLAGRVDVDNRRTVKDAIVQYCPLISAKEIESATERVLLRLFGLGDIEELFADEQISEIMINGPGPIWVERRGQVQPSGISIEARQLDLLIERIIAPLGRRVDRCNPQVDARLPDGSRVHIAAAPIALDGPYVTIRRFSTKTVDLFDFTTPDIAEVLSDQVRQRKNIIVSGATATGKTTLLNAICSGLGQYERVVTIEDSAELNLNAKHVVRLECQRQPASTADVVAVEADLGDLVKASLRMRPDRIIVGEVRGAEAFYMVQALLTGHAGSMSSVHASCAQQALDRIETLMMLADSGISSEVARRQIVRAFDLVIHLKRSANRRYIDSILTVDPEADNNYLVRDAKLCARKEIGLALC